MRCIITRASTKRFDNEPCPCNRAEWDPKEKEWYIELDSMEDLIYLLESNSNIFSNEPYPSAIVTIDINGNVEVMFYDDYIE